MKRTVGLCEACGRYDWLRCIDERWICERRE